MAHVPVVEIGLLVVVVILKALFILCLIRRKRSKKQHQHQQAVEADKIMSADQGQETHSQVDLSKVVITIPELTFLRPLPPSSMFSKPLPDLPEHPMTFPETTPSVAFSVPPLSDNIDVLRRVSR